MLLMGKPDVEAAEWWIDVGISGSDASGEVELRNTQVHGRVSWPFIVDSITAHFNST